MSLSPEHGRSAGRDDQQKGRSRSTRSTEELSGVTDHRWQPGPVLVRIRHRGETEDEDDFEWVVGNITDVDLSPCNLDHKDYSGKLVLVVEDGSGQLYSPYTWSRTCPGTIPIEDSDRFKTKRWVKHYDQFHFEGLGDGERIIHRILRTNRGRMGFDDAISSSNDANSLCSILLGDKYGLSLLDQLKSLVQKNEVKKIVTMAKGDVIEPSIVDGIAYLFGQMVGAELSGLSASQDEGKGCICFIECVVPENTCV